MNKPSLILIGAGGHAHSCIDVIEQQGMYQIVGLVGAPEQKHQQHLGYQVIASDDELPELVKSVEYALIAVGQIQTADHRIRLYHQVLQLGFKLPLVIAPTAYVSRHSIIGMGTVVMHCAIVNAGTKVGNNCIINTRALLEHDTIVGDHCHISTGAILNGDVTIGVGVFIGSGSVIRNGLSVGKECLIGMGLTVRHNLNDQTRFLGHNKT